MLSRPWWIELPLHSILFHFKWHPITQGINFEKLSEQKSEIQIVNHFEYNYEITRKDKLFSNLFSFLDVQIK